MTRTRKQRQRMDTPPWTRLFIEVALRALLRLHHDYALMSLPQRRSATTTVAALRTSPGVALADELTVCAAIYQEFLASRAISGVAMDMGQRTSIRGWSPRVGLP